jgi:hypothetical protein
VADLTWESWEAFLKEVKEPEIRNFIEEQIKDSEIDISKEIIPEVALHLLEKINAHPDAMGSDRLVDGPNDTKVPFMGRYPVDGAQGYIRGLVQTFGYEV